MKYIFLIVLSLLFVSCTEKPVPKPLTLEKVEHSDFVSGMISKYSLSQNSLKKIQFYTSHDIVLYKQSSVDSVSISNGTLLIDKMSKSNELIIKASTPCLFIQGDEKEITVAFDNNIVLNFVNPCFKCCSKSGKYYLAADNWVENIGTINIKGSLYKALGVSGQTYLLINKKSLENNSRKSIILKGRTLK